MEHLGGCRDLHGRIIRKLQAFKQCHYQHGSRSKGMLICGKPGTGKTALALAVAKSIQLPCHVLNATDVFQAAQGESEAYLQKAFDQARVSPASLLMIDDIDLLAGHLGRRHTPLDARLASLFLSLLDGLDADSDCRVFVIGVSSRPHAIDPCFLRSGRLDYMEEIHFSTSAQRLDVLSIFTKDLVFQNPEEKDALLQRVAQMTHGYVPSDLQSLCTQVVLQLASAKSDRVAWSHFAHALSAVRPGNLGEYARPVPHVKFSQVFGLDSVIQELKVSVIQPFLHPEAYTTLGITPPRGVLLHGPPGVGKTMLCSALAAEAAVNFLFIDSSLIRSKILGESEKTMAKLFAQARSVAPSILFMDQVDMILPLRGSSATSENTSDRIVTSFLTEMDGLLTATSSFQNVLVVAATNRLSAMDPAVLRPGRFDELIHVPLPDLAQRLAILDGLASSIPTALTKDDMTQLAQSTEGWSSADLDNLFREAAMVCLREDIHHQQISRLHFDRARSR